MERNILAVRKPQAKYYVQVDVDPMGPVAAMVESIREALQIFQDGWMVVVQEDTTVQLPLAFFVGEQFVPGRRFDVHILTYDEYTEFLGRIAHLPTATVKGVVPQTAFEDPLPAKRRRRTVRGAVAGAAGASEVVYETPQGETLGRGSSAEFSTTIDGRVLKISIRVAPERAHTLG